MSEATIHSFEMDKKNFRYLCTNVSINELRNVRTRHAAVTDSHARVSYRKQPGTASPMFSLEENQTGRRKPVEVEAVTIDSYVKNNCNSVEAIKVDVEGGEQKVIEGGLETIKNFHPHILLEVHPHQMLENKDSIEGVLSLLPGSYNIYCVAGFRDDVEENNIKPIDVSNFDPKDNTMLYAEPPEKSLSEYPTLSGELYEFT